MGLLDFFFNNKISEPVDPKPRTGFLNQHGEELAEYLTESDVQLLNDAVDINGDITEEIAKTLKSVRYWQTVFDFNAFDTRHKLMRAGLCKEDANRLTGVIICWAMGDRR